MGLTRIREKQSIVDKVKENVTNLKKKYIEMKNDIFKIDAGNDYVYPLNTEPSKILEDDEKNILQEEQKLRDKLLYKKKVQEKVMLKYNQVLKNLKRLLISKDFLKTPQKDKMDNDDIIEKIDNEVNQDDIYNSYKLYLIQLKETADKLFLSVIFMLINL